MHKLGTNLRGCCRLAVIERWRPEGDVPDAEPVMEQQAEEVEKYRRFAVIERTEELHAMSRTRGDGVVEAGGRCTVPVMELLREVKRLR